MICDREKLSTETTTEYLLALDPDIGDTLRQAMKAARRRSRLHKRGPSTDT